MSTSKSWSVLCKTDRAKAYLHFDHRCSLNNNLRLCAMVCDPKEVQQHGFFPFVHFSMPKKRIKLGDDGKVEAIEPKIREISYCSHVDRCIYKRYAFLLNKKYNQYSKIHGLDEVAVAYRNNLHLSNIDIAKEVFDFVNKQECCLIVVSDFSKFFDNIEHKCLKRNIIKILETEDKGLPPDFYNVYKNIVRYSYVDRKELEDYLEITKKNRREYSSYLDKNKFDEIKHLVKINKGVGIPQGSPISAVLSNIYMIEIDEQVKDFVRSYAGVYKRYCDDIVIVLPISKQNLRNFIEIAEKVINIFSDSGRISVNDEKTVFLYKEDDRLINVKTSVEDRLDYLGFNYDGKNITLRQRSLGKYFYRLRRKAQSAGYQKINKQIFPWNLYDKYSTCKKKRRYVYRRKELESEIIKTKRTQKNFIAYLNRVLSSGILIGDSASIKCKKYNKNYVSKYIKQGQRKASNI